MKAWLLYKLNDVVTKSTPWFVPSGIKYVSPAYSDLHDIKPCYKNLQDAIDDFEDGDTIIIYPGTYVGNFNWDDVVGTPTVNIYMHEGAWIKGTLGDTSLMLHNDSCLYGHGIITNDGPTDYSLELVSYESATIQAKNIGFGGYGVKIVEGGLGNLSAVIRFDIDQLGDSLIHHSAIMNIRELEALEVQSDEIVLYADVISDKITVSTSGKLMCSFGQHIKTSGNCFHVKNSGLLNITKGRIDRFAANSNTSDGSNYPFKLDTGQLKISNVQAKNVSGPTGGGVVWNGSSTGSLSLANVVFQSKGTDAVIHTNVASPPGPAPIINYVGLTSLNNNLGGIWTENMDTPNKVVNALISI